MARKIVDKTSFLGGEAGPLLEGRSDLAQYQLGVQPGQNFISLKGGGVTRRPGTRYVKNTQDNKPARLIPFVVSYDSGSDIYVVEIALASSTSLTFRVIRVSDGNVYTPTGSPVTVASTIELNEIQFAQSAEFLFLAHKSFNPLVLYRNASTPTFVVESYMDYNTNSRAQSYAAPFRDVNVTSTTLAVSATSGTGVTLTASTGIFDSSMVGTWFSSDADGDGDYEGTCYVTAYVSSTQLTVTIADTYASTSAVTTWRERAWSTYRGFPRTVTFYNQRLVWGGNTSQPDTFWMSEVGDYFQMSTDPTVTSLDRPLNFTLASGSLNQIRWMVGGKKLTIGTSSSEWVGTVTNDGTNLFVQFDEETNHGSAPVQPQRLSYAIPFIQRAGKTVREMVFSFDSDSYQTTDLNLFAAHIGAETGDYANTDADGNKIVAIAHQESPFGVMWVIDDWGNLYGLTRDRQQQIASWHSHVIGGTYTGNVFFPNRPKVISICVVPDTNGAIDHLWMCVQRTVNSSTVYHVEYMDRLKPMPNLKPIPSSRGNSSLLDCTVESTASEQTSWSSVAAHLASSTARCVASNDLGAIVESGSVSVNGSGDVTLDEAASSIVVGLHANAYLRLLPLEGGDEPKLHMQGVKRADRCFLRLHETFGLKIGKNRVARKTGWEENETFEPITFDTSEFPIIPTFTGIKEVQLPTDSDTDGSFALAMEDPWPCTVLSVSTRVVANEV